MSSLEAMFKREFSMKDLDPTGGAPEEPYGGTGGAWGDNNAYAEYM